MKLALAIGTGLILALLLQKCGPDRTGDTMREYVREREETLKLIR